MELTAEDKLAIAQAMQSAIYQAETDELSVARFERYAPIADKLGQRIRP